MKHPNTKNTGLIIRNTHLYAVQMKAEKNGPSIKNVSRLPLEEGIVEDDCIILNPEAFKAAIQSLLSKGIQGPFREGKVFITLPEEKVFSHQLTIPKEKAKDMDFIKEAAGNFIPIELDKAVFDAQILKEDLASGTVTVECVAVQSNIVKPLTDILKEAGLEVTEIDIGTNALIRAFYNQFDKKQQDFALVHMQEKQDVIALVSSKGFIYKHSLKHSGLSQRQSPDYSKLFAAKLSQAMEALGKKEVLDIKTVYLVGDASGLSFLQSNLAPFFPLAQFHKKPDFITLPEGMENDILEGVGLCLRGFEKGPGNYFNLITTDKKQELTYAKVTKQAKRFSVAAAITLGMLLVWLGVGTIKTYFNYQFTAKEASILSQQLLNPYVTELAKIKQQDNQKETQIMAIFNEILPLGGLLQELDAYGRNGISLTGVIYLGKNLKGDIEIQMRARADSREATERFVEALEMSGIYKEVKSPLSNLVGKGQRFINISLLLDSEKVKMLTVP